MKTNTGGVPDGGETDASHDFSKVRAATAGLERAIRSFRLHEGQGPTVSEHLNAATELLRDLVESGPLSLRVSSFGLLFGNRPLSGARGIDDTWFGLFADSVRDICFNPGLSADEVHTFVDVLCGEPEEGDDRVTLLWRREVHHIELLLSSLIPTRLDAGEDGDVRLVSDSGSTGLFDSAADGPGTSGLAFSRGDPRSLVGMEGLSWMTRVTSQPFETEPWVESARGEGGARARGSDSARFVTALLSVGGTDTAASSLLDALVDALLSRDPDSRLLPLLIALIEAEPAATPALKRLAQPESMVRFAALCDLNPSGFEPVIAALGRIEPSGLSALLVELRDGSAQARFAQLAGDAGGNVVPFYLQQLDSENEREALSAVEALAALPADVGVPGLGKALSSPADRVRYQALRSLGGRYHPDLAAPMLEVLNDPRRVHRLLALKTLEQSDEIHVIHGVVDAVKRDDFLDRDPEEQGKWLACLAAFPEGEVYEVLGQLLGLRSAMRKSISTLQLQVVDRLAQMEHPVARRLLSESKGRWHLAGAVRKAIAAAIEGGGDR